MMKPPNTFNRIALGCIVAFLIAWPKSIPADPTKVTVPLAAHRTLTKAQDRMEKEDYAGAAEVLKSFQAQKPRWLKHGGRDPEGYLHYLVDFNLANCYLALNHPGEAIIHYESVLATRPEFSPAWMNLAKACYDAGKYQKAADCFIRGHETAQEKQPDPLYYSAVSYLTADDHVNALKALLRLFDEYPNDIKTAWREHLVHVYLALDKPSKALSQIEILTKTTTGKRQRQWQEMLFYQYQNLQMNKKALSYAGWLIRSYPTNPKWWKALASLHLERGRHKEALAALMAHSYLNPASIEEYQLLGDLSLSIGIPIQAKRYYQKVLEERREASDYKRWIQSYIRLYRPEEALVAANEALKEVDDPDIRMLKGEILYDIEKYDEAVATFTEVVEKKPDAGRAWLMMGYAAWQIKKYALAKTTLLRATDFPDQKGAAQKLLTQLEQMGTQG
jgi:tetratricopeptide (TPR) repeat protein